jgi:glutathione S-transferase
MRLYYAPGACSLAPHIALREAGLPFDLEKVNLGKKTTEGGKDYTKVNPKGSVPALELDDGQILTEVAVLVQYIADRAPASGLAPKAGTMERYRLMEWLNFVSSEIHKTFGPLFNPKATEDSKALQLDLLNKRLDYVSERLGDRPYLMGDTFTGADAYLFTTLNWTGFLKMDLGKWPRLEAYMARVSARPAVKKAMTAEGLIK